MTYRRGKLAVGLVMLFAAGSMGVLHALGFDTVRAAAEPYLQTSAGLDIAPWNDGLARWVRNGRVDYQAVLRDREILERFVATLATVGPRSTPSLFKHRADKLAYYINAYNALVLYGVIVHWPIQSVHDVRGLFEPKAGFGFFYGLRFVLDGRKINLYNLEHKIIRPFGDARIHAAINCASRSCPPLAPYAFEASKLDDQLEVVARAFASAPHVRLDEASRSAELSAIYDWYREDFEDYARRIGAAATVLGFLERFSPASLTADLRRAQVERWTERFTTYDWRLNGL